MLSRRSLIEASLGSAMLLAASRSSLLMATGEQMLTRSIPASGEPLPVIGMGTSGSFDVPASEEALSPLREVLRLLLDKGGRVLDTAPSYGRAQTVSGLLLGQGGWRENVFLASKLGVRGRERGLAQFEESLRALRSKRLDLLQVHNLIDYRTLLGLLRDLKAQGRIRYLGVTHYLEAAHDELVGIVEREPLDFLQINLSVVSRNAERRLLPLCREKGVAVLINRAFEGGQLFARDQEPGVAALGGGHRLQLLGAGVSQVRDFAPGGYLRDSGFFRSSPHGRQSARRVRPHAGYGAARADRRLFRLSEP